MKTYSGVEKTIQYHMKQECYKAFNPSSFVSSVSVEWLDPLTYTILGYTYPSQCPPTRYAIIDPMHASSNLIISVLTCSSVFCDQINVDTSRAGTLDFKIDVVPNESITATAISTVQLTVTCPSAGSSKYSIKFDSTKMPLEYNKDQYLASPDFIDIKGFSHNSPECLQIDEYEPVPSQPGITWDNSIAAPKIRIEQAIFQTKQTIAFHIVARDTNKNIQVKSDLITVIIKPPNTQAPTLDP